MKKSLNRSVKIMALGLTLAGSAALSGCAQPGTGITLESRGYNLAQSSLLPAPLRWLHNLILPSAMATPSSFSSVKFCITQMKLESEGEVGAETEARLGLVDLGDGSAATSWAICRSSTAPHSPASKLRCTWTKRSAEFPTRL
jgi:hypothetical protein